MLFLGDDTKLYMYLVKEKFNYLYDCQNEGA
jgi:hypothetical protein